MTDLIEVKTADLTGEALGWAVGIAEGLELHLEPPHHGNGWLVFSIYRGEVTERLKRWNPWEDWALGGPLVDKHRGGCQWNRQGASDACYYAGPGNSMYWHYGPTALVAFCRGLVHSKLGDSVQVPKEIAP